MKPYYRHQTRPSDGGGNGMAEVAMNEDLHPPSYPGTPTWTNQSEPQAAWTNQSESQATWTNQSEPQTDPQQEYPDEKAKAEDVKAVDWNEFTQNTTFHGIKYIFEPSTIKLRR